MRSLFAAILFLGLISSPMAFAAHHHGKAKHRTESSYNDSGINDPIEPFNRAVFQFNRFIDYILINPVTKVYTFVMPTALQHGVTSFLNNLGEPIVMLNTALQGDWEGFGATAERFVVNSTLGVLGLNDAASLLKIHDQVHADFGQTLGKWGVGHGFYLVLPILGPSSARDGTGRVVDTLADPYNIAFSESDTEWPIYARAGLTIVDARARYGDEYDRTMKSATDPYVTFRSIYAQHRAYVVQGKAVGGHNATADAYSQAEQQ